MFQLAGRRGSYQKIIPVRKWFGISPSITCTGGVPYRDLEILLRDFAEIIPITVFRRYAKRDRIGVQHARCELARVFGRF
jgi:hypothetical protein